MIKLIEKNIIKIQNNINFFKLNLICFIYFVKLFSHILPKAPFWFSSDNFATMSIIQMRMESTYRLEPKVFWLIDYLIGLICCSKGSLAEDFGCSYILRPQKCSKNHQSSKADSIHLFLE